MKVLIPVIGSRGDIQIYINLGIYLNKKGYLVTIATHPYWKDTIENLGMRFIPIGPDISIEKEAVKIKKSYNIRYLINLLTNIHLACSQVIMDCIDKFDLLIVSHVFCGAMEAISKKKKYISVTYFPPIIPKKDNSDLFYDFSNQLYFLFGSWNRIKNTLKLSKVNNFKDLVSKDINLIPISVHLLKNIDNFSSNNIITGFWPLPSQNCVYSEQLTKFLSTHQKPIIVSLGAMGFDGGDDNKIVDIFIESIHKTGNSGIIQGFNNTIEKIKLPENILHIKNFPSDLFEKGKMIIHHCGFGTMTTALYSGNPSIPIPHILDQKYWTDKLYSYNLCPKPFSIKQLTEKKLIENIRFCETDERLLSSCKKMKESIMLENGLEIAENSIKTYINS